MKTRLVTITWKFPVFTRCAGDDARAFEIRVTRDLEDVALLRRALIFGFPGVIVPPGPNLALACSRDASEVRYLAPSDAEEAISLQKSLQRMLERTVANTALRDAEIFKSFCLDSIGDWDRRCKAIEKAAHFAPAKTYLGQKWPFWIVEHMGVTVRVTEMTPEEEADSRAEATLQAWPIETEMLLTTWGKAARRSAEATLTVAESAAISFDMATWLRAEGEMHGESHPKLGKTWRGLPFAAAT